MRNHGVSAREIGGDGVRVYARLLLYLMEECGEAPPQPSVSISIHMRARDRCKCNARETKADPMKPTSTDWFARAGPHQCATDPTVLDRHG